MKNAFVLVRRNFRYRDSAYGYGWYGGCWRRRLKHSENDDLKYRDILRQVGENNEKSVYFIVRNLLLQASTPQSAATQTSYRCMQG
jgi:hypothetical protein